MLMDNPENFLNATGRQLRAQVEKETREEMKVYGKVIKD